MAETRASYAASHRDRVNLLIHLLAVPLFTASAAFAILAAARGEVQGSLEGIAGIGLSLAAQALGHRREAKRPAPFDGVVDAVTRVPVEQCWGFWVFFLSGAWWRHWKRTR